MRSATARYILASWPRYLLASGSRCEGSLGGAADPFGRVSVSARFALAGGGVACLSVCLSVCRSVCLSVVGLSSVRLVWPGRAFWSRPGGARPGRASECSGRRSFWPGRANGCLVGWPWRFVCFPTRPPCVLRFAGGVPWCLSQVRPCPLHESCLPTVRADTQRHGG